MFDLSNALVAFPGGFGTMEEIIEMMTWKQMGTGQAHRHREHRRRSRSDAPAVRTGRAADRSPSTEHRILFGVADMAGYPYVPEGRARPVAQARRLGPAAPCPHPVSAPAISRLPASVASPFLSGKLRGPGAQGRGGPVSQSGTKAGMKNAPAGFRPVQPRETGMREDRLVAQGETT